MTDEAEKAPEKQQPEKKAHKKVGTGAWWKSAAEEEKEALEKPKKKAPAAAPKKRTPRKKKGEEAAEAAPESENTEPQQPVVEETAVEAISEQQSVPPQTELSVTEESHKTAAKMAEDTASSAEEDQEQVPAKKKRVRRRSKKNRAEEAEAPEEGKPAAEAEAEPQEQPLPERNRRKKQPPDRRTAKMQAEDADEEPGDDEVPEPEEASVRKVSAKLLINAEEPEECRIAIVEDGRLEAFHVTTAVHERTKNNIYKGKIVSIESNLQAAFVEIGTGRNGFLPFIDIHPEYYKEDISEQSRTLIRQQQWRKLKIEDVVSRGQEVLVQVVKEVTGNKGANITTYLSLPGRCLVLMPGSDSSGVSRKISGEERRGELRQMMTELSPPEGIGYIIRTASAEITKTALEEDLAHLLSLWGEIRRRGQTMPSPSLVYEEQDNVLRFLRDYFIPEIKEIIADTQDAYDQAVRFVASLPEAQRKVQVKLHRGVKPIFNQQSVEEQIESIYQPQVQLPSGGSIVINPTEALVAIDVNSGRTSQKGDFDQSIFLANLEAADELARQLRLRDLGGLIVVDFIDMRNMSHIKEVERRVKSAMKRDKAKVDISRISRFGLMQISRQKMGAPIEKGSYHTCTYCGGRGVLRSVETLALQYLRRIQTGVSRKKVRRVEASLPLEVGQYLLNKKRNDIAELENKHQATIEIRLCPDMRPNDHKIDFLS